MYSSVLFAYGNAWFTHVSYGFQCVVVHRGPNDFVCSCAQSLDPLDSSNKCTPMHCLPMEMHGFPCFLWFSNALLYIVARMILCAPALSGPLDAVLTSRHFMQRV